ncbi:MAG: hypothetical protein HOW73_32840 [Polyangiaceae bacterium]|nr:hypothetical protein [Polyangiaceae bacterium]
MISLTFDRSTWRAGYGVSFVLTLLASCTLVGERITQGELSVAWLCSALLTFVAIVCVQSIDRSPTSPAASARSKGRVVAAHALGAASAIAVVHVAVALKSRLAGGALVERPSQIVNDLVLVGAILGLVWSLRAANPLVRLGLPAISLGAVTLYFATARFWHLDPFPGFAVQRFVVQQALVTAGALLVFDVFRPARA